MSLYWLKSLHHL